MFFLIKKERISKHLLSLLKKEKRSKSLISLLQIKITPYFISCVTDIQNFSEFE